jgi:hypothetical protein
VLFGARLIDMTSAVGDALKREGAALAATVRKGKRS